MSEGKHQINGERLLSDLYALRRMGEYKTGVHRPSLSPEDVRSRHWLAEKLTEAGDKLRWGESAAPRRVPVFSPGRSSGSLALYTWGAGKGDCTGMEISISAT